MVQLFLNTNGDLVEVPNGRYPESCHSPFFQETSPLRDPVDNKKAFLRLFDRVSLFSRLTLAEILLHVLLSGHSSKHANHTSRRLQPLYICTTGIGIGPCSSSGDALHAHTLVR